MANRWQKNRASARFCFAIVVSLVAAGCTFGPRQLEKGHNTYNAAVRNAEDDELLLNIVRIRYLDTIQFMATNSVSSQLEFKVGIGAEAGDTTELGSIAFGRGEAMYSTRPTFTFIPQGGRQFSRQLIEPVPVDVIAYLIAADWGTDQLFRLLVRGANDVDNEFALPDTRFQDLARRLGRLHETSRLSVGFVEDLHVISDPIDIARVSGTDLVEAAKAGFEFRRSPESEGYVLTKTRPKPVLAVERGSEDAEAVIRLLGLRGDLPYYPMEQGILIGEPRDDALTLRTRSLLGAIVYLCQGVRVPDEHVTAGVVTERPFGLPEGASIADFFDVRHSSKRPAAQLAVEYRGWWFYIDDTDAASRSTFLHLAEVLRLGLSPSVGQGAPVLTLPLGG